MTLISDHWSVTMTLISGVLLWLWSLKCYYDSDLWSLECYYGSDLHLSLTQVAPVLIGLNIAHRDTRSRLSRHFGRKFSNENIELNVNFIFSWFVAWLIVLLELSRHFKSKTDTWNIWLLVTQSALLAGKNKIFFIINCKVKFSCLLTNLELASLSLNQKINISEKLPTFLVRYY